MGVRLSQSGWAQVEAARGVLVPAYSPTSCPSGKGVETEPEQLQQTCWAAAWVLLPSTALGVFPEMGVIPSQSETVLRRTCAQQRARVSTTTSSVYLWGSLAQYVVEICQLGCSREGETGWGVYHKWTRGVREIPCMTSRSI
jgi:hypothetical protein